MSARALLVAVLLAAPAVAAAPVTVGDSWRLDLPDGWTATEQMPEAGGGNVLASYRTAGGWRLVVGRQRGNTDAAYAGQKTFFAGLEEGVKRSTDGYKKLSARQGFIGKGRRKRPIPTYDLWYRTPGGVRGTRFVIMSGFAVMATIDVPRAKKVDAAAKKVIESFTTASAP